MTDPHHPLYGKCFPVSDRRAGRGPRVIVIRLPDGRERGISRSATALISASDDLAAAAPSRQAHISVRTLLPLANHVSAVLASRHVYVRQSSPGQVRHHQESTELQYRLVERATLFGWPGERVHVIDDDLGKSGASSRDRHGFQTLIAEVGLGKAGLVLSLDASRLARNNRDWHQLLELCSLFGVLIADGERLYDPAAYHDRLLLGLSGIMSEAELHQIKIRLHQGERQRI